MTHNPYSVTPRKPLTSKQFDPFDGRSVRLKTDVELAHGLVLVSGHLANCSDASAHAKMWRAILADIKSEIRFRRERVR